MAPALTSRESVPFHFDPFDVTSAHIIYACVGGFVVLFGMFSLMLREKLYIGEACWAFVFGVIVGPYGLNIFNPREWGASNGEEANTKVTNDITLELTRVVLSIGVFAIGVELPKQYMKKHWKTIAFMLGPVMTWGWFVSAGFIYALLPGLSLLSALAIAACLTPTDPILAAAVVGGKYAEKHVPAHIRHLLAAESGCNDGAAFPFLFLALYLMVDSPDTGAAMRDWFVLLWVYQIALGIFIGTTFGIAFRHLMKFCERKRLIDRHSYVAQYLSLALLTTGVTILLGSDDLLSTFSCGAAFAWDGFFNRQTEESVFSSVIDLIFNIAAFIYVGAWTPFSEFNTDDSILKAWRLVVLAICILLFRRLPIVLMCYKWIPDIKTVQEALFTGHFGPMGIGAIFISTLANRVLATSRQPEDENEVAQIRLLQETIQPVTAFIVLFSIAIHGLSIPSFSLGKRVRSMSMSRTWTRERSVTTADGRIGRHEPEWMDQVTRGGVVQHDGTVTRGDKDTEMDKFRSPQDVDDTTRSSSGKEPSSSSGPMAETAEPAHHIPRITIDDREFQLEEDWRKQNPPDGGATLQVWDEGPHRIIERRSGPGEEVEVEVLRYVNAPSREGSLRSRTGSIQEAVSSKIRHLAEGTKGAVRSLSRSPSPAPPALQGGSKRPMTQRQSWESTPPDEKVVESESEQDEAEGWEEEDDPTSSGSVQALKKGLRKPLRLGSAPSASRVKRRGSHTSGSAGIMKKALLPALKQRRPSGSSSPPAQSPSQPRGRPAYQRTQSRVDSLRFETARGSREASPTRSIRFKDEPRTS